MSISSALNNALSGLQAARRASDIVSNNVANALTPGYAARKLELTSSVLAGGVSTAGITRRVDEQLLSDHRLSLSESGNAREKFAFFQQLDKLVGTPTEADSLSAHLSDFEGALISAASRPDAIERLDATLRAIQDVVSAFNATSDGIQQVRSSADEKITAQVKTLNNSLAEVEKLNGLIIRGKNTERDVSSLLDQRQALVEDISAIVPVRVVAKQNDGIALYATGGAILLDSTAVEIEFTQSSFITPYMTEDGGQLSGLSINGIALGTSDTSGVLRGGTLSAQFAIRDNYGPEAQAQLDALARDLVERFAGSAVDPTLGATDPGLFTDGGAAFDPLNEIGLAQRLEVNALIDPDRGGQLWRLRDGLGAAAEGDPGDSTLLKALNDTLATQRSPSSGDFGTGTFSALDLTAVWQSQVGSERHSAEQGQTTATNRSTELKKLVLAQGVDTDAELQSLIVIEQVYAANARVIQAVDDMLQELLRIS